MSEAVFRSARGALMFAFNFTHGTLKKSALAGMMGASPNGRGLGGLDGAAQAGMIKAEVDHLPELHQAILIARWLASPDRAMELNEPITIRRILATAVGMEISRADEHGHSTRVGHVLAELGYERKENKSIPERYHYVKRHDFQEGDE